jgi:hypothetical protein
MWLPLYSSDPRVAFLAAGAASALVAPLTLRLRDTSAGPSGPAPEIVDGIAPSETT